MQGGFVDTVGWRRAVTRYILTALLLEYLTVLNVKLKLLYASSVTAITLLRYRWNPTGFQEAREPLARYRFRRRGRER